MANTTIIYPQVDWDGLTRRQQIGLMDEYYSNNMLYENTRILKHYLGVWNEDLRPLRSPVHRSVEFFAAKVAAGEPTISASKNQPLMDAIRQIMEWSNFQIVKTSQVRNMSKYGDVFRKVVSENGKVWHEMVETCYVTDFKQDPRGFLTEIRIDTPIKDGGVQKTRTEYWTINNGLPYMAVWEHSMHEDATIEQIQQVYNPTMYSELSAFGIDFIPFVRSSFADVGNQWGANCVEHALLKIDESNRQATKLHQTLFRYGRPTWLVSANQVTDDGSPVAAPDVSDLSLRDDSVIGLPGMAKAEPLIPNINYEAALSILVSQEKELEKDLPELLYYSMPEDSRLSGKALRTVLGAAIDRCNQAESSYVEGTIRLNQMAITVGQFQGIFPTTLGKFDSGQLSHSIRFEDPFPVDISDKATTLQTFVTAGVPLKIAMQLSGFSEEEVGLLPNDVTSTSNSVQPTVPTNPVVTPDQMQQMMRQLLQGNTVSNP